MPKATTALVTGIGLSADCLFRFPFGAGPCIARKTAGAFLDFSAGVSHGAFRAIFIHSLPPVEKGTQGLEERFLRPNGRGAA
jgi:hypothetical protein